MSKELVKIAVDDCPAEAKEWTVDRDVYNDEMQKIGTEEVQIKPIRVYLVEKDGKRQWVQTRHALPCIAYEPKDDDPVVARYWKVFHESGEVRDGPRDVTQSMWDAWKAAGAVSDVVAIPKGF